MQYTTDDGRTRVYYFSLLYAYYGLDIRTRSLVVVVQTYTLYRWWFRCVIDFARYVMRIDLSLTI
jgi:hypothetical protein